MCSSLFVSPLPPFCLVIASIDSNSTYPIILVQPYGDKECWSIGDAISQPNDMNGPLQQLVLFATAKLDKLKECSRYHVSYALLTVSHLSGQYNQDLAPARHRSYWQKFLDPIIIDPPSIWRFGETFGSAATWALNVLMSKPSFSSLIPTLCVSTVIIVGIMCSMVISHGTK